MPAPTPAPPAVPMIAMPIRTEADLSSHLTRAMTSVRRGRLLGALVDIDAARRIVVGMAVERDRVRWRECLAWVAGDAPPVRPTA